MKIEYKLTRVPVHLAFSVSASEYQFLDYLLYRHNLNNYQIHISTMVNELNKDNKTIIKLCKKFKVIGVLRQGQSESNNKHEMSYNLNYAKTLEWINTFPTKPPKVGGKIPPVLVESVPKVGGKIPPVVGGKIPPVLVEKFHHTASTSNCTSIVHNSVQCTKKSEPIISVHPEKPKKKKLDPREELSPLAYEKWLQLFKLPELKGHNIKLKDLYSAFLYEVNTAKEYNRDIILSQVISKLQDRGFLLLEK